MAITHAQDAHANSHGAASVVVPLASTVSGGQTLTAQICLPSSCSVASITDNISGRWIQTAYSYTATSGAEIWMARGVPGGSGASVTVTFTAAASVSVNVAAWSGVQFQTPLDAWTQNYGSSTSPAGQALQPRQNGDLFLGVVSAGASVSAPTGGYTSLAQSGSNGYGAGYLITTGSGASTVAWNQAAASSWAVAAACCLAGQSAVNPNLQFPEVEVQISTQGNYQAPLLGQGTWTSISNTVQSMTIGPLGRMHELDRVQACQMQIVCDNRTTGTFNPWNTSSYLYNSGLGLRPMNPVKITAAWNGVTSPVGYGYLQSVTTVINDVLNTDATLNCVDILQMFSLKYISNNNYAQLVQADGGSNLVAYYRLGDTPGTFATTDSSGNGATGSLIGGQGGMPAYGAPGALLYDANTALDATNGSNTPNGGFRMVDTTTQPPTAHDPLVNNSGQWAFEIWASWTQQGLPNATNTGFGRPVTLINPIINRQFFQNNIIPIVPSPAGQSGNVANGVLLHAASVTPSGHPMAAMELQVGWANGFGGSIGATSHNFLQVFNGSPNILASGIPNQIFDGNFHQFVYVSSSSPQWYVDGAPLANAPSQCASVAGLSFASPPAGVNTLVGVGQYQVIASQWPGAIDEVAIYSASLSAQQVLNHYNQGMWFRSQEFGASTGTQAASVARINKLVSALGLPQGMLNVPYPFRTALYGETQSLATTSGLNYLQTMTETEAGGIIFQGPNGQINAYSRQYMYLSPSASVSQATFADSTSTSLHYEGPALQIVLDDLDLWTEAQVESGRINLQSPGALPGHAQGQLQEWGPNQSPTLASSASVYGNRTLQGLTSLQFAYDEDALATAQNYTAWYGTPQQRVQQIVVDSMANGGANIPQMLQRGLFDRITTQYTGQTGGNQFSQDALIEQVSHAVDLSQQSWVTTYALSPYEITLKPVILGSWTFGTAASVASLTL